MSRHYGSIFWSLILISIGCLFLLSNMDVVQHPWAFIGRYWPVLIILWGVSKLVYFIQGTSNPQLGNRSRLGGGDIVLLFFLLMIGSLISKATQANWPWPPFRHWGEDVRDDRGWDFDSRKNYYYTDEASLTVDGKETSVEIQNSYGNVDINIHDLPQVKVKVEKRIKEDDEKKAGEIGSRVKLKVEKKGAAILISTNRDELEEELRRGLKTNISIWVPHKFSVRLNNQYGDVTLTAVSGNHVLNNQYGSLTIKNVEGNLQTENKYGGITIFGVSGDCTVTNKYAAIELENVGGKAIIDGGYGAISLKKIKGEVRVSHKNGNLECQELDGPLDVDGKFVSVKGDTIAGDVKVVTSYRKVELENVQGAMSVDGKHGDIEIRSDHIPLKPIKVNSEYGGISISLPKASQFKFDGFSRFGKLESDFEGVQSGDFNNDNRTVATQGKSGPLITVNTTYRDIRLEAN
jgi:DUF4097 and DUF4098 domain-containing protein YvlB